MPLPYNSEAEDTDVLTLTETAKLLRVSVPTIRDMLRRGELPAKKVGRQWRLSRTALIKWLEGNSADLHSRRSS